MDSTGVSPSAYESFKSKKVLRSSVSKQHSSDEAVAAPDQSPWSSKTPEKPTHAPRRPITRRQALRSVNQVREAAKKLQKSDLKPSVSSDSLTSSTQPIETPIAKPNTSKSLPEKYEVLDKFFNSLESSIRLLGLKGSMSTFTNISRTVESLTDRRFAYSHLAQLKFLLPEGIEIKRILVRDDRTSCMKPDLHVTLNFSIIQNDEKLKSDSGNIQMRKLFRARLVSFCKSNPEGDEVPEEQLPEPFNQLSRVVSLNPTENPNMVSVQGTTNAIAEPQPAVASHMSQSFKRRFSKRVLPALKQVSDHSSTKVACVSNLASPVKWSAKLPETPIKTASIDGTPSKLISTPFSATPAQAARPPVRCFMSPDEDSIMSPTKLAPRKLTRRSSGRRSITFDTPVKNRTPHVERASSDDDLLDILPVDLLASIKEKERKAIEENDPAISQAKWRKQMIAGLPRLFDILLFFFQSIKRSVITKEELVHRIISNHLEIVDRREVDEQLRLLLELAPEWIYKKMSSTGDLLFCVNKISSPESIRTRLSEAS
ncbi:CDT1-like protein a, chloroplastic [Cynara cardunculus var. scolymus]|uniref:CDT1-like protein a, chloroplastic n=1 Tax=Cynara cardunculus var. scolymus TaxID=59895 RepID=UPI000D62946F|nr:CDT1-like protein a, chloroplastic [Cynara cardunculus var. scolymus]